MDRVVFTIASVFLLISSTVEAAPSTAVDPKVQRCDINFFRDLVKLCLRPESPTVCIKNYDDELMVEVFEECCYKGCDSTFLSKLCCDPSEVAVLMAQVVERLIIQENGQHEEPPREPKRKVFLLRLITVASLVVLLVVGAVVLLLPLVEETGGPHDGPEEPLSAAEKFLAEGDRRFNKTGDFTCTMRHFEVFCQANFTSVLNWTCVSPYGAFWACSTKPGHLTIEQAIAQTARQLCCRHRICSTAHFRQEMCCHLDWCHMRCTDEDRRTNVSDFTDEAVAVYDQFCRDDVTHK
ncbi:hypothetical protein QR680_000486 [Steinernema hermaphroditum]|uniref:SREBP regulating gene protein n=1 Tax=Steinernema hermaphroditum TaxID=289476 RepID=A0AA39LE55_9BILA|nr:hypothetical protein QR680_000486 [Steinernema hermaphroditum]